MYAVVNMAQLVSNTKTMKEISRRLKISVRNIATYHLQYVGNVKRLYKEYYAIL